MDKSWFYMDESRFFVSCFPAGGGMAGLFLEKPGEIQGVIEAAFQGNSFYGAFFLVQPEKCFGKASGIQALFGREPKGIPAYFAQIHVGHTEGFAVKAQSVLLPEVGIEQEKEFSGKLFLSGGGSFHSPKEGFPRGS